MWKRFRKLRVGTPLSEDSSNSEGTRESKTTVDEGRKRYTHGKCQEKIAKKKKKVKLVEYSQIPIYMVLKVQV